MFTGIVEKTLRISAVSDGPGFRRLVLPRAWDDVKLGASIAVNGVCLTIAELTDAGIGFDVVEETLQKTNLGALQAGDDVHVERSLRVGDPLDGHFVLGHVDGTALLLERVEQGADYRLRLETPNTLARYLTPKGSVTLDGVSLTLAKTDGREFEIALIPTTLQLTALGRRSPGWRYNFEADVMTKTTVNWLERHHGCAEDKPGVGR